MNMKIAIAGAVAIPPIPGLKLAKELTIAERVLAAVANDFQQDRDIVLLETIQRDDIGKFDPNSLYFLRQNGDQLVGTIIACGPLSPTLQFEKADDNTYFMEVGGRAGVVRVEGGPKASPSLLSRVRAMF